MKLTFAFAGGVLGVALLATTTASAGSHGGAAIYRVPHPLPPVSGTLRLSRSAFGRGGLGAEHSSASAERFDQPRVASLPRHVGHLPRGYQGHAFSQLAWQNGLAARSGGVQGRLYAHAHRPWWQGDGTGLVGLVGNEGYAYAGAQTGWGTADSATTGGAYPLASARYTAEAPLEVVYGEPDLSYDYRGGSFGRDRGVPPTGGLAYYSSGSPGTMAYYSSSSLAGPYGSPGGLGIYSSGSYGPGPRIIHVGQTHRFRGYGAGHGCFCGPHIIHVGHRRHYASR